MTNSKTNHAVLLQGLNDFAASVHSMNVSKGFWSGKRDFGRVLMLIVSEVAEALEAERDGRDIDWEGYQYRNGEIRSVPVDEEGNLGKPIGVPSELADTIIRVLDACGAYGIDIERAILTKLEYNLTRSFMHGRTS